MSATKQVTVPRAKVVRIFFDYPDFRLRVDDNSPVHYDAEIRRTDTRRMT